MRKSKLVGASVVVLVAGLLWGCAGKTNKEASKLQKEQQATTNGFQGKLTTAEPYPADQMTDSAERANLRERLVRLNDPHKVGFLYGLSSTGQVMAFWTIKGKPSSMGSQLTVSQNIVHLKNVGTGVLDSMGDDGTFGPEECQSQGIFAFTADTNALIEWCGPWFYSDAPLKLTTAPVIVVDPSAKPTSDVGLNKK